MSHTGAAIGPAPRLSGAWSTVRFHGSTVRLYILAALSSAMLSLLVVAGGTGPFLRLLCALVIGLLLCSLAFARPGAGVIATFIYLVFMELLRRVLIPASSWTSGDPLLLVGPLVSIVLLVKLFVLERRKFAPNLISTLLTIVLILTFVEVANPSGFGLGSNVAGLLYMAAPLFWFYIGREVLNDSLTDQLMAVLIVLGVIVGLYGLYQTQVGDPPWDVTWLNTTGGYSSLIVGGTLRAWGTFASFAEYALFLGAALVAAVAFALRGRPAWLLATPVLGAALFLSSGRSALVTAFAAIVVMAGLRTHRPQLALLVTVCAVGAAFGGLKLFGSQLAGGSSSALVSHELGGITDPLNPNSSTLLLHVSEMVKGVETGFTHPLGKGPGVTNNAAGVNPKSNLTRTQASEVDISNAFVALGVIGGLVYLAVVVLVLAQGVISYFAGKEAMLPMIGVLIVGAGQWLTGGDYAVSPFCWLLAGGIAGASRSAFKRGAWARRRAPRAEPESVVAA